MSLEEVYTLVRSVNFLWAFVLFIFMIYYGIIDLLLSRQCNKEHVPPEHHLWATASMGGCFILCFSLAEILARGTSGGLRVFTIWLFLIPASFALREGSRRVRMHAQSVKRGHCK